MQTARNAMITAIFLLRFLFIVRFSSPEGKFAYKNPGRGRSSRRPKLDGDALGA
jgi:hypothetical protein